MKDQKSDTVPMLIVLLNLPQVIDRCKISRAEIYRRMNAKTFPKPVKLSPKKNVWPEHIIQKWMAEQLKRAKYEAH